MTFASRILACIGFLLAWIPAIAPPAYAQTSVVIDARVVALAPEEIDQLRISENPAFVRALSRQMSEYLMDESRSKMIHRIELPATAGTPTQFRLDSRIAADAIGLGIEITPKVFENRDILLATSSQVRIRRDPDSDGKQKLVFENPPTKFETRIQEGVTIILGGFITDAERMSLPAMSELPDNPILKYLFGKLGTRPERPEIAVLLTPRINGAVISAASDAVVRPTEVPMTANPIPAAKQPAPKSVAGIYTVQIGAFDKQEKAEMLAAQLMKKHDDVFIEKISQSAAKSPYRVRVGRLPDMRTARQLQRQLAEEGFDTYITTLE